MPESKQAGHSRLFILFHFFIALPLYSFKRKRSWVFNIAKRLSPFQLGDVRSSCRPKWKELISENLLCCNKCRVPLVSCWWPLMSLYFSSTQRHCSSSPSLPSSSFPPPCPPRLRISSCEGESSSQHSRATLSLKKRAVPAFIIQPAASLQLRLMFSFTGIFALNIWLPESRSYTARCWYATWGLLSIYFI